MQKQTSKCFANDMESNANCVSQMLNLEEHPPIAASRASNSSPNLMHFFPSEQSQETVPSFTVNESETIQRQRECKQRLEIELESEKKRLKTLQRELEAIQTPLPMHAIQTLSQVIQQLRNHCKQMTQVIDEVGPTYALGETDRAFYANADAQRLSIQRANSMPIGRNQTPPPPIPAALRSRLGRNTLIQVQQPPLSASPNLPFSSAPLEIDTEPALNGTVGNRDEEEAGWVCNMCTFRNNCLLTKCEQCDMPFLPTSNRGATNSVVFMQMQQQQYL